MHGLHPNAQVVLQGFRAFAEGDMAAVKPLFHDDAIWHSSGRNRFSGDFRGVDAIMRLFAELSGAARIENEPHAVLADEHHVIVLINGRYSRPGARVNAQSVFIFHLEDGKVAEVWVMFADPYALDEFWGHVIDLTAEDAEIPAADPTIRR
jgi:ketosteroid isomerase-like protein